VVQSSQKNGRKEGRKKGRKEWFSGPEIRITAV
jgi:hypothetical protein